MATLPIIAKELSLAVAGIVKAAIDERIAASEARTRAYVDREVQLRVSAALGERTPAQRVAGRGCH